MHGYMWKSCTSKKNKSVMKITKHFLVVGLELIISIYNLFEDFYIP